MTYYAGFGCPEGFDLVVTDAGPACAHHAHAPCLSGHEVDGRFVCTDWDFPCPPGTSRRRGSPQNWCFSDEPTTLTGVDAPPWYAGIPALGPLGMAEWGAREIQKQFPQQAEALSRGVQQAATNLPSSKWQWPEIKLPEIHFPEAQVHLTSDIPSYEKQVHELSGSAHELSEGLKKAAVIVVVGALAYGIIRAISASGEG